MAEVKDERPIFRVTQAPGFATGVKMYSPGEEIVWAVPEEWNVQKYGRHFASYGPSTSFEAMNPAAEKLAQAHKIKIEELRKPKPTADDERAAKLEKLVLDLLAAQGEAQAEARRSQARYEELMEQLIEAQTKKK